ISAAAASTALLAGVLAAFNPCGFALLPAYITVIVTGSAEEGVTRTAALRRAVGFGLAMTLGFVAVFLAFGALFAGTRAGLRGSVLRSVSWITLVIGPALIVLGVPLMRGGEINVPGLKLKGPAPTKAFGTQVLYGAGFAIASLSCTIGPFL